MFWRSSNLTWCPKSSVEAFGDCVEHISDASFSSERAQKLAPIDKECFRK